MPLASCSGVPSRCGRSAALRKLTPWLDAEARVVGYVPGKGRLQGKVGALRVGQDADAVGAALSDLLADTAERDRMTEAGRRLVERGRGALAQTPERADRVVFDLDPGPDVPWRRVVDAARLVAPKPGAE